MAMSEKQSNEFNAIMQDCQRVSGKITTIQAEVHKLLIRTVCYVYIYRDCSVVEKVLNNIKGVRGSFKVEALSYWFWDIAGIECTYDDSLNEYTCRFDKGGKSDHGVTFTYDKAHLSKCKQDIFRFWRVAPVRITHIPELKLPSKIQGLTNSAEIKIARMIAAGAIEEQEVVSYVQGMVDRIRKLTSDKEVSKWVDKYHEQHPEEKILEGEERDRFVNEMEEEMRQVLNTPDEQLQSEPQPTDNQPQSNNQ